MDVFTFVIILVLITTLGKAAVAIAGPLAGHVGDFLKEVTAERRARRGALEPGAALDSSALDEIETRLARIEDRLDFVEQLRAPEPTASLLSRTPQDDS